MRAVKRKGQWFVVDVEPYQVEGVTCDYWGPYDSKAEAESDIRGINRTCKKRRPKPQPVCSAPSPEPVADSSEIVEHAPPPEINQQRLF